MDAWDFLDKKSDPVDTIQFNQLLGEMRKSKMVCDPIPPPFFDADWLKYHSTLTTDDIEPKRKNNSLKASSFHRLSSYAKKFIYKVSEHFYILNFAGGGFLYSEVKKKKKEWCKRICMEIILS